MENFTKEELDLITKILCHARDLTETEWFKEEKLAIDSFSPTSENAFSMREQLYNQLLKKIANDNPPFG